MAGADEKRTKRKRADGEGSLYFSESKKLWVGKLMVGYRPDGKPDVREVSAKTQREARAKLDGLRQRQGNGTLGSAEKERETVGAFLDRWLDAARATVRPKTHKTYSDLVRVHLQPGVGRHKLSALKPDHVQGFYADKLDAGSSPQTVVHLHRVLHRALTMAVKWGYVPRNVCTAVDPPKVQKREMHPPTPEEVSKLLAHARTAEDRYFALWQLAAFTGARQGELLGLQWDDIDFSAGVLRIRRSLQSAKGGVPVYGEPKTAKSRRTVPLVPEMAASLRAHRAQQDKERGQMGASWKDCGLVFTSIVGTPLDGVNVLKRFKAALKAAGVRQVRFHDLRHGAITMMLGAGLPVTTVSEMVGHHSAAMTLGVYGHVLPGSKQLAAETLGAMLGNTQS